MSFLPNKKLVRSFLFVLFFLGLNFFVSTNISAQVAVPPSTGLTPATCGSVDLSPYLYPSCEGGVCPEITSTAAGNDYSWVCQVYNHVESVDDQVFKQYSNNIHFLYENDGTNISLLQDTIWPGFYCDGTSQEAMYRAFSGSPTDADACDINSTNWGQVHLNTNMSCGQTVDKGPMYLCAYEKPASIDQINNDYDMQLNECSVAGQSRIGITGATQLLYHGQAQCCGQSVDAAVATTLSGSGAGEVYVYCKGFGLCAHYQSLDATDEVNDPRSWGETTDLCNLHNEEIAPILPPSEAEGNHLCRSFCFGDSHDPCKYTPENDCSYPYDWDKILSRDLSGRDLEIASEYFNQVMARSRGAVGFTASFDAQILNPETCDVDSAESGVLNAATSDYIRDFLCSQQEGQGAVYIGANSRTFNSIVSPTIGKTTTTQADNKQASEAVTPPEETEIRTEWNRGYFDNNQATTFEGFGAGNVAMAPEVFAARLSAMVSLKEDCFLRGFEPIGRYFPSSTYGDVRCMNYQWLFYKHPQFGTLTERDVFWFGDLRPCMFINNALEKDNLITQCLAKLTKLQNSPIGSRDRAIFDQVMKLPTIPIATMPIIAGVDEIGPSFEDQFKENVFSYILGTNPFFSDDYEGNLNFFKQMGDLGYGIDRERLGAIGTGYQITGAITGQDAKAAARLITDMFTPVESQDNYLQHLIPPGNVFTRLFAAIGDFFTFFSEDRPFWYKRIPEDLKEDQRYLAIQLAFNKNLDDCLWPVDVLDKTTNDVTLPSVNVLGFDGNFSYEVENDDANLINTINQLKAENQGYEFPTQGFLYCELYPDSLKMTDAMVRELTKIYTSPTQQQFTDIDTQKKVKLDLQTSPEGEAYTQAVLEDNCALNKPGVPGGDNNEVETLYLDGSYYGERPLTKPPCYGEYCGPETAYECPDGISETEIRLKVDTPSGQAALEAPEEFEKPGVTIDGFNVFGEWVQDVTGGAFKPVQVSFWQSLNDNMNEYYCNITGGAGPNCPEPENTDTSTDVCSFDGGWPIVSEDLKALLAEVASKNNIPVVMLNLALAGENCRSASGKRNVCNQTDSFFEQGNYLDPGVPYGFFKGCPAGTGTYPGLMGLYSLSSNSSRWDGYNICSINDYLQVLAKYMGETMNHGSSRQGVQQGMLTFALGSPTPAPTCQGVKKAADEADIAGQTESCEYRDTLNNCISKVGLWNAAAYCCAVDRAFGETPGSYCTSDPWVTKVDAIEIGACQTQ